MCFNMFKQICRKLICDRSYIRPLCTCLGLFSICAFYISSKPGAEWIQIYAGNTTSIIAPNTTTLMAHENCILANASFGKSIPLRFLASYPRSGNTWLRYLLESATGILTGSVYSSSFLYNKLGYKGEKEKYTSGRLFIVKDHGRVVIKSKNKQDIILLFRNPARSIISFWNYREATKNKRNTFFSSVNISSFTTKEFHIYVKSRLKSIRNYVSSVLSNANILHIVFYETLVQNPIQEVRGILKVLKEDPNEERISCLRYHLNGKAKRKSQEQMSPYTPSEENELRELLAFLITKLKDFHVQIPDVYEKIIKSETNIFGC